jgi:hypothetical protein
LAYRSYAAKANVRATPLLSEAALGTVSPEIRDAKVRRMMRARAKGFRPRFFFFLVPHSAALPHTVDKRCYQDKTSALS